MHLGPLCYAKLSLLRWNQFNFNGYGVLKTAKIHYEMN